MQKMFGEKTHPVPRQADPEQDFWQYAADHFGGCATITSSKSGWVATFGEPIGRFDAWLKAKDKFPTREAAVKGALHHCSGPVNE